MNRDSKLKLSVSTSLVAKVLAMLLQLVTLPVAAASLGANGLVLYAMLLSVNSWLLLTTSGLSPAMVVRLSGTSHKRHLLCWATNGYVMFVSIGVAIFALVLLLNQLTNIGSLLFASEQVLEAKDSLQIVVFIFLLQCVCIGSDAIILANQKQYLTNIALIIASSLSLLLLHMANVWIDSPAKLIAVVMIPSLILRMVIGTTFVFHKKLLNFSLLNRKYQTILFKSAIEFFKVGSLTNFLLHVLPILVIGRMYASDFSAQYAALNTLVIVASSTFTIICTPLLPALRESLKNGDREWFSLSLYKLKKYCLGLIIISLLVGWTFAAPVLNYIFTDSVLFNYFYVGLAATYFATLLWSNFNYTLLSAANEVKLLSKVFMRKSVFSILVVISFSLIHIEIPPFAVFIFAFLALEYTVLKGIINKITYEKNSNSY